MTNKEKNEILLRNMFSNRQQYDFEEYEDKEFAQFIESVLAHAEGLYVDGFYYKEYESFHEFLYTEHVDELAYGIYVGKIS